MANGGTTVPGPPTPWQAPLHNTSVYLLADGKLVFLNGMNITYEALTTEEVVMKEACSSTNSSTVSSFGTESEWRCSAQSQDMLSDCGMKEGDATLVDALKVVNKIDAAIAFYEGRLTAISQMRSTSSEISSRPKKHIEHNKLLCSSSKKGLKKVSNGDETTSGDTPPTESDPHNEMKASRFSSTTSSVSDEHNRITQMLLEARTNQQFLWLFRCIAEESTRRQVVMVEERVCFASLLLYARQEMVDDARVPSGCRACYEAKDVPQSSSSSKESILTDDEDSCTETANSDRCCEDLAVRGVKNSVNKSKAVGRPAGSRGGEASLSRGVTACFLLVQTVVNEAEEAQRLQIEKEFEISLKLIRSQKQLILNHISSRSLIAAKEELMYTLIEDMRVIKRAQIKKSRAAARSERPMAEEKSDFTQQWDPPQVDRVQPLVRRVCDRACSPHSQHIQNSVSPSPSSRKLTPKRMPDKLAKMKLTPHRGTLRRNTENVARSPPPIRVFHEESAPVTTPPSDVHPENIKYIAFSICMRVEYVKRRQLSIREQRAWNELVSRMEQERGRMQRSRMTP